MRAFTRCLIAELLKTRRTPALAMTVVAPYVVVLLPVLIVLVEGSRFLPSSRIGSWSWLARSAFVTWCLVVLPLFLGLLTSLLAAIEHRAHGFRHLFALPVRRLTLYLAKQAAVFALVALAFALLAAGVLLAGLLLRLLRPGLGFEAAVPWRLLAGLALGGLLASGFVTALQTWIALLRQDVAAPIGLAVLATGSVIALRAFDATLVPYHPWSYPGELIRGLLAEGADPAWWVAGLLAGLAFAAVSGWSFTRRDVL